MCSVLFRAAFIGDAYPAQSSLSRFLYPIASARWEVCIDSQPSRSAIVRDTFKIRSYARAERLKRFMAFFNKASPLSSGRHSRRVICYSSGHCNIRREPRCIFLIGFGAHALHVHEYRRLILPDGNPTFFQMGRE